MASSSRPARSLQASPAAGLPRSVGEDPVPGNRKERQSHVVRPDLLGQRHRFARRLERLRVERLRHEGLVPDEQEVAGRRVGHECLRRSQHRLLVGVERADPVGAVFGLLAGLQVEEVFPVGKKLRPPHGGLLARRVQLDGDRLRPSRRRDAVDRIGAGAVEEDHAFRAPAAVRGAGRIADLGGRPSRHVDLLHDAVGHETHEAAVRRPEGTGPALGAGKGTSRERVERPHPDAGFPLGVGRVERQDHSVGRNPRDVDRRDFRRRRDVEAHQLGRLRRAAGKAVGETGGGEEGDGRDAPGELLAVLAPRDDGRRQPHERAALRDPLELQHHVVRGLPPIARDPWRGSP